ncbi:MAG: hypothetical protein ACMXX7_02770 [Candidatus Woesearchaeota archaeon]
MKTKIILVALLLIISACTITPNPEVDPQNNEPIQIEERWEDPRITTILVEGQPLQLIFYPNSNSQEAIITNEITDQDRNKNVVITDKFEEEVIQSINTFLNRNNITNYEVIKR